MLHLKVILWLLNKEMYLNDKEVTQTMSLD